MELKFVFADNYWQKFSLTGTDRENTSNLEDIKKYYEDGWA